MLSSEVQKLPGGQIAFWLLVLGLGALISFFVLVALAASDVAELKVDPAVWIVPVWASIAVILAFRLRQERSQFERWGAGFWLAIGGAALAFIILGIRISTS
jgi:cytochrome bd-type quinol oxidase subunit 2